MFTALSRISILSATLVLLYTPAWADRPFWAGGDNHRGSQWGHDDRDSDGREESRKSHGKKKSSRHSTHQPSMGGTFTVYQWGIINNFYRNTNKHGRWCPPGLAKWGNGCIPPGQAKKWKVGYPLPEGIIYEPLPTALLIQLGPTEPGYQFVRVAGDILKIAIGSHLVIDAIQDLGK